jgi:hypothetical protein
MTHLNCYTYAYGKKKHFGGTASDSGQGDSSFMTRCAAEGLIYNFTIQYGGCSLKAATFRTKREKQIRLQ